MRKILETLKRKWAEYLLEIIVITMGILLAFGLNNWNENRKEGNFERKVLNELHTAIQVNIDHLNRGIRRNESAIASCQLILNHFDKGLAYDDSLVQHFSTAISLFYPSLNNNAYESLKSHGLHLLKNDAIRDTLGTIYEWKWLERMNLLILKKPLQS